MYVSRVNALNTRHLGPSGAGRNRPSSSIASNATGPGMSTSMITTSGRCSSTASSNPSALGRHATISRSPSVSNAARNPFATTA